MTYKEMDNQMKTTQGTSIERKNAEKMVSIGEQWKKTGYIQEPKLKNTMEKYNNEPFGNNTPLPSFLIVNTIVPSGLIMLGLIRFGELGVTEISFLGVLGGIMASFVTTLFFEGVFSLFGKSAAGLLLTKILRRKYYKELTEKEKVEYQGQMDEYNVNLKLRKKVLKQAKKIMKEYNEANVDTDREMIFSPLGEFKIREKPTEIVDQYVKILQKPKSENQLAIEINR